MHDKFIKKINLINIFYSYLVQPLSAVDLNEREDEVERNRRW